MSPTFQPPTADTVPPFLPTTEGPARRLFRHYKARARGRSVLRIAGAYLTVDTPGQAQIDTATEVYLGGHVYTVTDAVATALAAAGYTTTSDVTPPASTLTWGALGALTWDEFVDQYGTWE